MSELTKTILYLVQNIFNSSAPQYKYKYKYIYIYIYIYIYKYKVF